jgi:HSP20 family protein
MKTNSAVKEREVKVETTEEKALTSPLRRDPYLFTTFSALRRDMNQIAEDFARGIEIWRPHFVEPILGDFHAKVDFKNTDKELIAFIEVPGVDYKDIEILLGPDFLTVKGEKKEEKEIMDKGYFRAERRFGSFQRVLPLPYKIDREHVEATHKDGVLKIVMPKTVDAIKEIQKINIKNGGT